jgi:hypothetical protein
MKIVLLFLATLTAIGQSTLTQTWYHPPCKAGDQQGAGITGPDAPKWQDEKTGLWCIHIVQPKKHKAPVKPAWNMDTGAIDDGFAHWQAPKRPTVPEAITCEGCGSGDNLPLTVNKESCTTTYKGKWSDDTKTCYLVEQLGAVGAMMEQIAPEKPAWDMTPPMFTVHCNSHGCGNWNSGYSLFDKSDEGCSGPGMGDLVQPPADHEGWTGLPDPLKTAQDGYDCTMSRTPKTITINCTLKEPK